MEVKGTIAEHSARTILLHSICISAFKASIGYISSSANLIDIQKFLSQGVDLKYIYPFQNLVPHFHTIFILHSFSALQLLPIVQRRMEQGKAKIEVM